MVFGNVVVLLFSQTLLLCPNHAEVSLFSFLSINIHIFFFSWKCLHWNSPKKTNCSYFLKPPTQIFLLSIRLMKLSFVVIFSGGFQIEIFSLTCHSWLLQRTIYWRYSYVLNWISVILSWGFAETFAFASDTSKTFHSLIIPRVGFRHSRIKSYLLNQLPNLTIRRSVIYFAIYFCYFCCYDFWMSLLMPLLISSTLPHRTTLTLVSIVLILSM